MFDLFMDVMEPTPETSVLDLGVTPNESLSESNFFEQLYPYKNKITAVSIEDAHFLEASYPGLRFVRIQPGKLPFTDDEFDVVFCSAVIEHVGGREVQRAFIKEALRVGRRFFFTSPNRRFPIDVHTFIPLLHWLPQPLHHAALRRLGLEFWAKTENLNLLTPEAFRGLFPPGSSLHLFKYRLLGMPSNTVIYGQKHIS
ncbi:MAG: methyltransferase domain-containing protein [Thermodesulfovibrionales bacterium]